MDKLSVGILDTKVNGQAIDDIDLYRERGYQIINSGHLDKGGKHFDIVATTWTRLNEKRIKRAGIKGIVVKDNDEPDNVVSVDDLRRLGVPYGLIGLWGINTRVRWNMGVIDQYAGGVKGKHILMVANTPSHDHLEIKMYEKGAARVNYPYVPNSIAGKEETSMALMFLNSDIVIVHLGKEDFPRYWLDQYMPQFKKGALFISTTRGPLYTAKALNAAVSKKGVTAVLDWAWQGAKLIEHDRIVHTGHSSYRSEESGRELSEEVITAVEKMKKRLARSAK